jgi:ABC-type uncharacterized transport system permease subunit
MAKGKIGMARAILNDEDVAETMGVNATSYKVAVFAVAAFFAGVAGRCRLGHFSELRRSRKLSSRHQRGPVCHHDAGRGRNGARPTWSAG